MVHCPPTSHAGEYNILFFLLDEGSLNTKVFMIIVILSKQ